MAMPDLFVANPVLAVPPSYPVETAPHADGTTTPPILLWDGEWIIGYWSEEGWSDWVSGRPITPTAWAPLPQIP